MNKKNTIKVIAFLAILIASWNVVENVLQNPKHKDWDTKAMEKVNNNKDYYDVLISGTSLSIDNINAEELYLKYGISAISIGEPQQMPFLSYYSLEEALRYQSPKLVIFDVQALFYTVDQQKDFIKNNSDYLVHYTLDDIKNNSTKYKAITQLKELDESISYMEYFSKMYHNHSNWEKLSNENFQEIKERKNIVASSGMLFNIYENCENTSYVNIEDNVGTQAEIPDLNVKYLRMMAELCNNKNIKFLLVRGSGSKYWTWEQYNAITNLAKELDVEYLDMALCEEKIGFDWQTDSYDSSHHNVIGAKKWSDFLGEYICQKYSLPDRRSDSRYSEYELEKEKYLKSLCAMEQKIDLSKATTFNQYMETLYLMNKSDSFVAIVTTNSDINGLSEFVIEKLNDLGIDISQNNKRQSSLAVVLEDGKLQNKKLSNDYCEINGNMFNGISYNVVSSNDLSKISSSISINNTEVMQSGDGIKIVVYNKTINEVISSVLFNIDDEKNPMTSRVVNANMIQKEVAPNYWIDNNDL